MASLVYRHYYGSWGGGYLELTRDVCRHHCRRRINMEEHRVGDISMFFTFNKNRSRFILMSILLIPDCIRNHLSFNNKDSICFSGDMSDKMTILLSSREAQLERTEITDTSIAWLSLSKSGLGQAWSLLYLSNLRQSLTELTLMSSSTLDKTE